jgi:hypothetical protein
MGWRVLAALTVTLLLGCQRPDGTGTDTENDRRDSTLARDSVDTAGQLHPHEPLLLYKVASGIKAR